ncbi:unnamed protein product [Ilex paraguariensis]|uniref:Uncharacterized protein n=1 Tax=Ilex paraguariensis TaxID=185542 RepID=A0ABC8QZ64_9AQUA
MDHLITKSIFCTLLTIALLSFTKLLLSHLSVPFPINLLALTFPLLPAIIHLYNSISNHPTDLPPGPRRFPIFGNWLQVGNDLNHRLLASMSNTYGPIFLLKLGSKNLAVVSDPELANQVLHTQGVEFGSRPRNVVFDIFTGNGQDMVFTIYGDHWRKMRRIMTLPFFTNKVVHHYRDMWEQEMDLVVHDLKNNETVRETGIVIRKRLQLMLYNIMYRMMFDAKFESENDPLFIEATRFNSERSKLAQSFEYNYGDFIPFLRPFLRGYLNKCRDLQHRRLTFFNNYYVQKRREIMAANGQKHSISCAIDHIIDAQMKGEINPKEFRPERFLEEESSTEAVAGGKVDFRYLPFGEGRRSCPGIILALPILGLVIAKLVSNFEMLSPAGLEGINVSEKGGQFSLHIANHSTVVFKPI